jgi:N-acyl-D-aspartate/D-glutamate deacylase
VREEHALSLTDAIRKMSLMPAQRLRLPNKGRIRVGADADITVFDPDRVIDRATFERPAQYSTGIPYVLVGGTVVVSKNQIQAGIFPGSGIRFGSAETHQAASFAARR